MSPLPATPTTVANYISRMADDMAAVATIERRLAAIAKSHKGKAAEDPTALDPTGDPLVRAALQGIKRQLKDDAEEAKPLTVDLLARILEEVPRSTNAGRRDRALVLIGFYGAFRRSELSSLMAEGVLLSIPGSWSNWRRPKRPRARRCTCRSPASRMPTCARSKR